MFDWLTNKTELKAWQVHARNLQEQSNYAARVIDLLQREKAALQSRLGSVPITKADKKLLLKLCHPDKHGGCKQAEELFKRINKDWK